MRGVKGNLIKYYCILIKVKLPADHSISGHGAWQTKETCTIYLLAYVVFIRYIPVLLIVTLNIAIGWKLNGIWKLRRQIRTNIGVDKLPSAPIRTRSLGRSPR